jgi:hypothetical protein
MIPDMMTLLQRHLDAHQTAGIDWPADAQFAVLHAFSTWPSGFQKRAGIIFFPNKSELDTWMAARFKWAQLEDNHFAYRLFEWNLGPVELHGYLNGNVPSGVATCVS